MNSNALFSGPWFKPVVFIAAVTPFGWCLYQVALLAFGYSGDLGADPGKALVLYNGTCAIVFLLITLSVTPLRELLGIPALARVRRMLGLFTFFYVFVHLSAYIAFLLEFQFSGLWADVLKRPYITVGFTAFLLLVPLAATSNRFSIRRLKRNWKKLHLLVYPIGVLGVVHVVWLTKSEYQEAFVFGLTLLALLAYRLQKQGFLRSKVPGVDAR